MTRMSNFSGFESPTRSISRSCSARSSLAWRASGIERHFVDEQRAVVGQLEAADARGDGAGERALHVAEQLGLDEALGNAPRR